MKRVIAALVAAAALLGGTVAATSAADASNYKPASNYRK
jgi:hypothetical protein